MKQLTVLEGLSYLEKQVHSLTEMYKKLSIICASNQDHRVRQIDENRKISRRVDDLQNDHSKMINDLIDTINSIDVYVRNHEQYLKGIAKIAMCDPDKVLENQKVLLERIKKLESLTDFDKAEKLIFNGAETHSSILRCEAKFREVEKELTDSLAAWNLHDDRINSLEDYMEMEDRMTASDVILRIEKIEDFHAAFKDSLKRDIEGQKHLWENIIDRVNKLEQSRNANSRSNEDLFGRLKIIEDFIGQNYKNDIEQLSQRISHAQEMIFQNDVTLGKHDECLQRIMEDDMKSGKIPHKCPVCDGDAVKGWYEDNGLTRKIKTCASCEGTGIIWG